MSENPSEFHDPIPSVPRPELPFMKESSSRERQEVAEKTQNERLHDPQIGLFQRLYLFYRLLVKGKSLEDLTNPIFIENAEDIENLRQSFGSIIDLDDTGIDFIGKTVRYNPLTHTIGVYSGKEKQDDTTLESSFRIAEDGIENPDREKNIESGKMAMEFGKFVARVGPYTRGGKNSCGKAVGEILDSFGIEGLPQEARHGKRYTEFLDARPTQFKKVKLEGVTDSKSLIRKAGPGAIIVYTGKGKQNGKPNGSLANQEFGHVEILASNGKFTSFYDSPNAGGSAQYNSRAPEDFQEQTGWTGYVYYPIQKKR